MTGHVAAMQRTKRIHQNSRFFILSFRNRLFAITRCPLPLHRVRYKMYTRPYPMCATLAPWSLWLPNVKNFRKSDMNIREYSSRSSTHSTRQPSFYTSSITRHYYMNQWVNAQRQVYGLDFVNPSG